MTTVNPDYRVLIGGELRSAASGRRFHVLNPATEEVIAEVPDCDRTDVEAAIASAGAARDDWAAQVPSDRSRALLALAQAIEDDAEGFAALETLDVGKPQAVSEELIPACVDFLRYFACSARVHHDVTTGEYVPGRTSTVLREPVGIVGAISTWNDPLAIAVLKIGAALAAGNVLILKPSELAPLTTIRLAEIAADILPPGVLNVVTATGPGTGMELVANEAIDMVSYTGSVSTGKIIARDAAGTLKRVHLELGGKAPAIVFDDADLELAVQTIGLGGFYNSGQDCTAACRVLVQDGLLDRTVDALVKRVTELRVGDPAAGPHIDMGPLISSSHRSSVMGFVERAVGDGGEIVTGGRPLERAGFFMEPTVLVGVAQTSEAVQKEIFGPVVTVQRFADEEDAIAMANDVHYGLASSVFTENGARALRVARRLKFGTVWVNDHLAVAAEMPFGGYRESGYGKELSTYSSDCFTQIKHVMLSTARHDARAGLV
jgi:1-pyrroline dehydrogenase